MRRFFFIFLAILVVGFGVVWWRWHPAVVQVAQTIRQTVTPQPTVRFAVVGDNHGVNPVYRQILSDIKGQNFQFLLNLGDTSNEGKPEEWQAVKELESTLTFPVYHTVGSHDINTDDTRNSFTAAFGHAPWYAIDSGQLHLIILDNADRKVGFPAKELDWLERDLAAHETSVNILAYHRPFSLPLASLLGDDETAASAKTNERLTAMLRQYNVKQIFTSHLHTNLPYTLAGVPAVVSGGGGDPAQFVLGGAKNNYFHYLEVTIKGSDVQVTPIRVAVQTTASPE
jgi:hypothetical protein